MKARYFLSPWVRRFLLEYLISEKNLSKNTQRSYRDTLQLCLPYIADKKKKLIDQLEVDDLSQEIVTKFLMYLESERNCSVSTRNQRLAAIHSLAQFIASYSPEYIEWHRRISLIPIKKTTYPVVCYLDKNEMNLLLNTPDRKTSQGSRDYAILLFLYNTGCRADEVAQLKIKDIDLNVAVKKRFSTVQIKGKGNKLRRCPLWEKTAEELSALIYDRDKNAPVFLNRNHQSFTRFGIYALIKRYIKKITPQLPSLAKKQVSPHTIRHTTATHLLRAGVDINTIRAWLGHVSINTTNIYTEVDLDTKARALSLCEITDSESTKHWRDDNGLMGFLKTL